MQMSDTLKDTKILAGWATQTVRQTRRQSDGRADRQVDPVEIKGNISAVSPSHSHGTDQNKVRFCRTRRLFPLPW